MQACPHCNQALQPPPLSEADAKALANKSTERDAQNRKLVALLKQVGRAHTYQLRKHGISHPAGRVQDLEAAGFVILSERTTVVDENGFVHPGVALYSLVSEPFPFDAKQAQEGGKSGAGDANGEGAA